MEIVIVVIAIAVLGIAAAVAAGKFGEMAEAETDVYAPPLNAERLTGDDLEGVRFGVQARGYHMGEVDEVMARMARELDERDQHIAALKSGSQSVPTLQGADYWRPSAEALADADAAGEANEPTRQVDPAELKAASEDAKAKADAWRGKN